MSILWRGWLTFTAITATILLAMTILSSFQFNVIFSNLIKQRLSVVAQSTAVSFRSVVELGLPLTMVRNARTVLDRARRTDPRITAIQLVDPEGFIVHSTRDDGRNQISEGLRRAANLADSEKWSLETEFELNSGFAIRNAMGATVGNVIVVYPKHQFEDAKKHVALQLSIAACVLLSIFALATYFVLRGRLKVARIGLDRLGHMLANLRTRDGNSSSAEYAGPLDYSKLGVLGGEIAALEKRLTKATKNFNLAKEALQALADGKSASRQSHEVEAESAAEHIGTRDTPIAQIIARRLVPFAAILILGAAGAFGAFTITAVNRSIEPELASRMKLIGATVSKNIQRAVTAGVPLEGLVGAERYFGSVLTDFPELSYIGVNTTEGRTIIQAGHHTKRSGTESIELKNNLFYPINSKGKRVGQIVIETDPAFIASKFRDVLLDLLVVILVAVLLTFEVTVILTSMTLTAPLVRLQKLATLQEAGDFSARLQLRGRSTIDRLAAYLSDRTETLHTLFKECLSGAKNRKLHDEIQELGRRYNLGEGNPSPLVIHFHNNIRLPLFTFVLAEELATPFLPLFTRANANPWPWVDQGIVISLPIVSYLVAILIASPFVRGWANRVGHRQLFLMALVPGVIDNLGLFWSSSVSEIIFWRCFTGIGYALATLACQDYVLDLVPKEQRSRAIGTFVFVVISGTFCGTAAGGILADRLGARTVFLVGAALVLIAGLLALRLLGHRPPQSAQFDKPRAIPFSAIRKTLSSPRFVALVFGIAIPSNILLAGFLWYLVPLSLNDLGASTADIGRAMMLYYLLLLLMGPLAARLSDLHLTPDAVSAIGNGLSGLALLLPVVAPSQWLIILAVCGAGLGHAMVRGPQIAVAFRLAETELVDAGSSVVLGALRSLERLGSIFGLLTIALLAGWLGYGGATATIGVFISCAAVAYALLLRDDVIRIRAQP